MAPAVAKAYQATLFGDNAASRVTGGHAGVFQFHPRVRTRPGEYDPTKSPSSGFDFCKHDYGRIGDFDCIEEF